MTEEQKKELAAEFELYKAETERKKAEASSEAKAAKSKAAMQHLENSIPLILEVLWEVSAKDIEATLEVVTKLYLRDVSVPWIIRSRRAAALQRMGRIFQDIASTEDEELDPQQTKAKL